jgi:hypothetical protein
MTGGDDHEAWLDVTVGEWSQLGESELGEIVTDHAEERAFPQVFDESGLDDHDRSMPDGADAQPDRELSEADAAVLEEARELTKEMLDEDSETDADESRDETE